jgi:4-amino-4-deoxy-L-arabinose transferase-like glycosyltransferase
MEGGTVDHVRRILSGQRLYVSPSLEFVPYAYTPLYFYVSAAASRVLGVGFTPLRLISFLSSIGCFAVIFLIVKRETRSKASAFLASCLFAATFRLAGAWLDIARVDSLFLLFLLGALYLIRFGGSARSDVLAGLLLSLSFLTKQSALIVCLPLLIYRITSKPRSSIPLIGTTIAIFGGSTLLLNYIHDGWYVYYVFDLLTKHSVVANMFYGFWTKDILSPLSIACVVSIAYFFIHLPNAKYRESLLFYLLAGIGMLGAAWLSRLSSGGYNNVLLPAYAFISILFGLGIHSVFEHTRFVSVDHSGSFRIVICLAAIIQFLALIYNPLKQVPSQKDLETGRSFINQVAQIQGEILVPYHGYLPAMAGKATHALEIAIEDILRAHDGPVKTKLVQEIEQAIRSQRFSAIIVDDPAWLFHDDIDKYYVLYGRVFDDDTAFWPVTGMRTRPELIYIPKTNKTNDMQWFLAS